MNGELFEKGPATEAKATYYAEVIEENRYWKYYGTIYRVVNGEAETLEKTHADSFWDCRHKTKKLLKQYKRQGQPSKKWTYR